MTREITCGDLRKWLEKMSDEMPVRIVYGDEELKINEAIPGAGVYKLYADQEEPSHV